LPSDEEGGFNAGQRQAASGKQHNFVYPNASVVYHARGLGNSQPHVYAAVNSSHVAMTYYDQDDIDEADNGIAHLESGSSARSSDRSIQI
jgi:mevalonate pyrophosphate decarboxylase